MKANFQKRVVTILHVHTFYTNVLWDSVIQIFEVSLIGPAHSKFGSQLFWTTGLNVKVEDTGEDNP